MSIFALMRPRHAHFAAFCLFFAVCSTLPAQGLVLGNPYAPPPWVAPRPSAPIFDFDTWNSTAPERPVIGSPLVSADILRHPLSGRAQNTLFKIERLIQAGDHTAALTALHLALRKFAPAAPYIQNLLGIEYVATGDFPAAKDAFASVVDAMPHVSANYANYAQILEQLGEKDHALQAVKTALALDDKNTIARRALDRLTKPDAITGTATSQQKTN